MPYYGGYMQQYQQPQQASFIRVQNEQQAREWPIAPGGSMTFIDDNAPYCYTKSMGMSQFDVPVFKRFKLTEEPTEVVHVTPEPASGVPQVNLSDYITKAEFEPFKALLERIEKELYNNEPIEQRESTATAAESKGASSCNA